MNMIDITNMSDAALDAFLAAKGGADVLVGHLTETERTQVASAMGWDVHSYSVQHWIHFDPLGYDD